MPHLQSYGERNGGLVAELWKLLQVLGGFARPMYHGNHWVVNDRDRGVICHLTVYTRKDTRASQPLNIFVKRINFAKGV